MPEIAYDLFSGQYVEVKTEAEEAAENERSEYIRRRAAARMGVVRTIQISSFFSPSALAAIYEEMRQAMEEAALYGSSMGFYVDSAVPLTATEIRARQEAAERRQREKADWGVYHYSSGHEFFIDWLPKPVPYHQPLPARTKYRGRALQANQPGDQPWKRK